MTNQQIKSGDNSVNTQNYGHNINAPGGNISLGSDNSKKYEFIKEILGFIAASIFGITSFLTNPTAEAHLKQIARGPYSEFKLDRDFYYDNNFFFSSLYVIGKNNAKVIFSYGYFGRIQESRDFNYNLERIQNEK